MKWAIDRTMLINISAANKISTLVDFIALNIGVDCVNTYVYRAIKQVPQVK